MRAMSPCGCPLEGPAHRPGPSASNQVLLQRVVEAVLARCWVRPLGGSGGEIPLDWLAGFRLGCLGAGGRYFRNGGGF